MTQGISGDFGKLGCFRRSFFYLKLYNGLTMEVLEFNAHDQAKVNAAGLTDDQVTWKPIDGEMRLTAVEVPSASLSGILDLSGCEKLVYLNCTDNLTSLNLAGCVKLKYLRCSDNQLTTLDLSSSTLLEWLWVDNNQLTTLDVSKNTALDILDCRLNQLSSLDVPQNTALEQLYADGNCLTFSTLPLVSLEFYTYAPQNEMCIAVPNSPTNLIGTSPRSAACQHGCHHQLDWEHDKQNGPEGLRDGRPKYLSNKTQSFRWGDGGFECRLQ